MHIRNYEVATDVAGRRHFRHPAWQRSPAVPPGEAGTAVPAVRWQRHPAEHLPGDEQSPERNGIGAGSVAKQRRRERDSRVETLKARVRQHQPATPLTLHLPGICLGTVDKKPACGDFSLAYLFSFLFNWLSLSLAWTVWKGREGWMSGRKQTPLVGAWEPFKKTQMCGGYWVSPGIYCYK